MSTARHSFLRDRDRTITTFDPQGAIASVARSINLRGELTGYYLDANDVYHGFLRAADGSFTTLDAPGAAGSNGTMPQSINARGEITGSYQDASGLFHSFLWRPDRRERSEQEWNDEGGEDGESPE